jgi:uncharacterized glyoxalase superfamily protein PhnB
MIDTTNTTQGITHIWPTFRAKDARALIRFLVDAFGFEEVVVYDDGDLVSHAELAWPSGGGIMFGSVRPEPDPWGIQPGTAGIYVVTDAPDALFARATAAGAEVLRPPEDTHYGSREFSVKDPEGNRWSFGTYAGHRVST